MKSQSCSVETCDMYDFMSDYVGRTVLHPGGLGSTKTLLASLKVERGKRVLDIACGRGITSLYIAQQYGCHVEGVDISEKSIEYARQVARKKGLDHLVRFQTADALELPFGEQEFDYTIAQAVLILVKDKLRVIQEATRVLKSDGLSGWNELSWRISPPQDFIAQASAEICAVCLPNVMTFDEWESLLYEGGMKKVEVQKYLTAFRGMKGMIADEGLRNGLRIMGKYISNRPIRNRMMKLDNFFQSHPEYVGYGIYIGSK